MRWKVRITAGSDDLKKHLSATQLPKFPAELCEILTDSSHGRTQVTIIFWGYEVKGQEHNRLKWPWKHLSNVSLLKLIAKLHQIFTHFSHGRSQVLIRYWGYQVKVLVTAGSNDVKTTCLPSYFQSALPNFIIFSQILQMADCKWPLHFKGMKSKVKFIAGSNDLDKHCSNWRV